MNVFRLGLARCLSASIGLALMFTLSFAGVTHAARTVTCMGHVATIVGTSDNDHLRGTSGRDVMVGMGGNDVIDGRGGNDLICEQAPGTSILRGGPGRDRLLDSSQGSLAGGWGNDHLRGKGENTLDGGPGDDVLTARAPSSSGILGAVFLSEPGNDQIRTTTPGYARFVLDDSPRGIRFNLRAGLLTGRGHTTIHLAQPSHVEVYGSHFDDVLLGTARNDVLVGGGGDDVIDGRGGADVLEGGHGHNLLRGGPGNDGFADNVPYDSHGGSQVVHAGAGDDSVTFTNRDRVYGGRGNDSFGGRFVPGSSPQVIDGGPGTNELQVRVALPSVGAEWAHVLIDLGRGRVDADGRTTRFSETFRRLILLRPSGARRWTLNGTGHDDYIYSAQDRDPSRVIVEHGRAGDDTLVTVGAGNDVLWGGPGTDQGYAGDGTDICHSIEQPTDHETSTYCETSTP